MARRRWASDSIVRVRRGWAQHPGAPRLRGVSHRLVPLATRVAASRLALHLLLVLAVAGAIVLLDQGLRPIAQSRLTGVRIPLLGGGLVLERLDDPATAAALAAFRIHLALALGALVAMAIFSRFMGWYGIALLAAFGLILGGAESNSISMLVHGFVLNWIGYRIDGPVMVVAPADLMQMAGLAVVTSSLTLFTAATLAELLPARWLDSITGSMRPISARAPNELEAPGPPAGLDGRWEGQAMVGDRCR